MQVLDTASYESQLQRLKKYCVELKNNEKVEFLAGILNAAKPSSFVIFVESQKSIPILKSFLSDYDAVKMV